MRYCLINPGTKNTDTYVSIHTSRCLQQPLTTCHLTPPQTPAAPCLSIVICDHVFTSDKSIAYCPETTGNSTQVFIGFGPVGIPLWFRTENLLKIKPRRSQFRNSATLKIAGLPQMNHVEGPVLDDVDSDDNDMPALNGAEGAKDAATEDVLDDDEVRARADVTGMRMDRDRDGTCLSTPNNVGRPGSEQRAAGRRPAVRCNRLLRRAAAPGARGPRACHHTRLAVRGDGADRGGDPKKGE